MGDDDFIDLTKLLHAVLRYKWGILGFALLLGLVTSLVVSSMEPVYRASASIVLESQEAQVVNVDNYNSYNYRDYDYYQTQFEILKSMYIAERVVRRLELHNHPFFQTNAESESSFDLGAAIKSLLPAREQDTPA